MAGAVNRPVANGARPHPLLTHSLRRDRLGTAGCHSWGRITSGPLGAYSYGDGTHLHAATAAGSNVYTYDANGAITTRSESGALYTHGYDLEGRQTTVAANGTTTTFVYDGDGPLVAKQVNGVTAIRYVAGGLFEVDAATGATKKLYHFGGRLVAVRDSSTGLHYLHQDHLGSTPLQTSSTGAHEGSQFRGSFGQPWLASGTLGTDFQYTGQRSFEAGPGSLVDYGSRSYSAALGNWRAASAPS